MAAVIRMRRMGRKNQPYFRIVATDKRSPRDGRFLEILGTYNPLDKGENFNLKKERILYWMGVGAQVSIAVAAILKKAGIEKEKKAKGVGKAEK